MYRFYTLTHALQAYINKNGDKIKSCIVETKHKNTKRITVIMGNAMRKSLFVAFLTAIMVGGLAFLSFELCYVGVLRCMENVSAPQIAPHL